MAYKLTKQALLLDLHAAFQCAKRKKANKTYVRIFERNLHENLESLLNDLWNRNYTPEPSSRFAVAHPVRREVFAAQFRDRIVHHLYYNYTHQMFERTFIQDCYSCIENRGTHYGIKRLAQHIREESQNYQRTCYILKLDIRGYFMHISRTKLCEIASNSIRKMSNHKINKDGMTVWSDVIDLDFVLWLTSEIALLDPAQNCVTIGGPDEWEGMDHGKMLSYSEKGCGLPIGNLTSQLFSNVYLNTFDQFMKREMHCRHYGRYVDDAYVVSCDKQRLKEIIPKIKDFLENELHLELHMGKLKIREASRGVEFLGGYVKPYRIYLSNESLHKMLRGMRKMDIRNRMAVWRSVNSRLGLLKNYASYNIRCEAFMTPQLLAISHFNKSITKFYKPLKTSSHE